MAKHQEPAKKELSASERRKLRMERTLEDAIHISDRFAREPVFGPTGKGSYKSAGVEGLKEDMARLLEMKKRDATS